MCQYEEKPYTQENEILDIKLFNEWFATVTANNPNKYEVTFTEPYTRHDGWIYNKSTGKKYKIEFKHLNSRYTKWKNWILNYEKFHRADFFWLHYDDGYVVLASKDQLTRFIEDYAEEATITHQQLKYQGDPNSPMIKQLQFNVPHTEAGNYFSLYKDGKKLK